MAKEGSKPAPIEQPASLASPNPLRSAAGKQNRARRGPLTDEGRERLREAAFRNQPWKFSTGPTTTAGKRVAAQNGRKRQRGPWSTRQIRAELAELHALVEEMQNARRIVGS